MMIVNSHYKNVFGHALISLTKIIYQGFIR